MKTVKLIGIGTIATALVAGCGAAKDAANDVEQRLDEPKLMQTWEGKCHSSDLLDLSTRTFYRFSGNGFEEVRTFYGEANCVGEAADVKYTGKARLRDQAQGASVRPLDFTYEKVEVKATSPKGKETLDRVRFCGEQVWEIGRAANLTGKTGTATCPLRTVPSAEYNVFALDGETLFFGQTGIRGGARVETDRPAQIDGDYPFRKSTRDLN